MDAQRFWTEFHHIINAPNGLSNLRNLILEKAVHGQLTPKTAPPQQTSLLKIIANTPTNKQQKKRQFHAANQPKQTNSPYPKHWEFAHFGSVWQLISGRDLEPSKYNSKGDGIPYITGASNIEHGKIIIQRWTQSPEVISITGDTLITCKGTIGKIAKNTSGNAHIARQIMAIRNFSGVLNTGFLDLWLKTFTKTLISKSKSMIPGFSRHDLELAIYPLPPLEEQSQIVAKVDELMALCDRLEELQQTRRTLQNALRQTLLHAPATENLKEFKNSWERLEQNLYTALTSPGDVETLRSYILKLAVTGRLSKTTIAPAQTNFQTPSPNHIAHRTAEPRARHAKVSRNLSSDELGHSIPPDWNTYRLGELAAILNGRAYSKPELLDRGTPVLRVGNLFTSKDWYYSDLQLEEDKYCNPGDLIYAWSASFGPFIWKGPRVIFHYHIWKVKIFTENKINKEFLYWVLKERTASIKESGHGISMAHMTKRKMEQLPIAVPPLDEQLRITEKIKQMMTLCDRLQERLTKAQRAAERFAVHSTEHFTGKKNQSVESNPMKPPQTELLAPVRSGKAPRRQDHAPLAAILARQNGELPARDLWQRFGGEIDAFYAQLKTEVANGWILEPDVAEIQEIEEDAAADLEP